MLPDIGNFGDKTVIRRSPLVLIRIFIAIEILGFAAYLLAVALGNYKYELYTLLFLPKILSYQAAKILFLTGGETVLTIYAFLRWYYDIYIIRPSMVSREWGLFFKKKKNVPLHGAASVTLSSGPVGKIFHYGSIFIQNSTPGDYFTISDISYPQNYFETIERNLGGGLRARSAPPDVENLLSMEEHERLEFKSSLRFDHRSGNVNRELEKAAMKTIAAFLNSQGGYLVIGVGDGRRILGIRYDYETLPRSDADGFENHFTQVFNKTIGPESRHLVRLWFPILQNSDICIVDVMPSSQPVYLKTDNDEHFYIRTGNVSTPLRLSEIDSFVRSRWPQRTTTS